MDNQNNLEHTLDMVEQKKMTIDEANVQMVRDERVRVVYKLPASVRKALNQAVKNGTLGHLKKDGVMPEVYYHPNFKYMALEIREQAVYRTIQALKKVCASPTIE